MCGVQDKNTRDVLMHLHEWHKMMIEFHNKNMADEKTVFLPEGFTWKTTPELNMVFWNNYQNVTLDEAKKLVTKSHDEAMKLIEAHTNDELFERGAYGWTGTTTLGSYFISATSSHYDWAVKQIKKLTKGN